MNQIAFSPRWFTAFFLLGLLCLFPGTPTLAQESADLDSIVAIVNDDIIVRSELEERLGQLVAELRQKGTQLPSRAILERQVLERLILVKLQVEAATQAGIQITDDMLAQALANIARENNMTLEQFHQALAAEGISFRTFREDLRDQLIISRLHNQQVTARIVVTDQEVEAFLAKASANGSQRADYHLLHILIATPEGASAQQIATAQAQAQRLVARIREGADFRETALAESDGRQALEGGDLGWRPADQLPSLFADRLTEMERGEITDPIRNASGFHIIKLEDYTGGERHIITQTHARHILINTNEITSDQDANIRLDQLRQRIEGGDDFANLARSHSDDKGSAIKGGDLGWVNPGDLVPRFEEQMNLLQPNEVSMPFRTRFGWHIVQVLERREHDNTEEVIRAKARNTIRDRKANEESELFVRRLRDEAYIEIRLASY
jgi:peptidyl-prolyl cis-trans isomerase SurA